MSIDDLPENQVDDVIQEYLDQLLIQATESQPAASVTLEKPLPVKVEPPILEELPAVEVAEKEVAPNLLQSHLQLATAKPELKVETELKLTTEIELKIEADTVLENTTALAEVETVAEETAQEPQPPQFLQNIITPNWRDSQGVECLIFKVGGLKLAIPLSVLGGVHPVTDKITPLFGQATWSLGIWAGEEYKLTIIDSALLMMPERNISMRDVGYQFFIQLDRSPWALACQEICDTVTLKHESIKWRGNSSKRPWLAGTVIDEMCVLLDVPEILVLLEQQRQKSSAK